MEAISKVSMLDLAIQAIQKYIVESDLQPGAVLPAEFCSSSKLGISRNITREAIQHFKTLGIVMSKTKVGNILCSTVPVSPYENYKPFLHDSRTLRELSVMRKILELGAVSEICREAREDDILKLEELQERMIHSGPSGDGSSDLEVAFHSRILEIPRNRFLSGYVPLVIDFFTLLKKQFAEKSFRHSREEVNHQHRMLIDAIIERDPDALRTAFEVHGKSYVD